MVTPTQEDAFTAFDARWADASTPHWRSPLRVPDAVALFMRLHEAGAAPDRDEVRAWFRGAGWADDDACELAGIAERVRQVLEEHDRVPRGRSGFAATSGERSRTSPRSS